MRRKSERNKAKGSPEKKMEKPTRKSTRRRAKKSPSASPEPEVECDTVSSGLSVTEAEDQSERVDVKSTAVEEKTAEDLSPEDDNNGSVWKVARADASPGEIQKLKLCRQRNISEASSDNSVERKKSNKWQESGEGVAEEDESAEEPVASSEEAPPGAGPDDACSELPARGPLEKEEVSDSKETPVEITPANLSDDMPNADRQGEQTHEDEVKTEAQTTEIAVQNILNIDCSNVESTRHSNDEEDNEPRPQEPEPKIDIKDDEQRKQSSDDENRHSDSSSNGATSEAKQTKVRSSVMLRRKHRDKYQDSSNSESNDSEDEREEQVKAENENARKMSPANDHYEESNEKSKSPREEEGERTELRIKQKEDKREEEEDEEMDTNEASLNKEKEDKEEEDEEEENETGKNRKLMKEVILQIEEKKEDDQCAMGNNAPTTVSKPTKINLKRSFTRSIIDSNTKKENGDKAMDGDNAENKENCAIEETKTMPKRRRWGVTISNDVTPAFSVSTDSLKALVPEAKPLSLNEVRLTKDDDLDNRKSRDRKYSLNNSNDNQNYIDDNERKMDPIDNHIGKRKISIVKESHTNSPSPPAAKPSNILLIKNLVRPFTLNQIKELLSRTGKIVENGFWMDRIKSKCFVEYSNEDQAFETRQALHGISWPLSNPKKLQVEYSTKEDMLLARETSKDQPLRKTEAATSSDTWQQGWTQEEKNNSNKLTVVREWDLGKEDGQAHMKEKEREKKDEKKRRQRSVSPSADVRLPPPARKFKKKEDEPPPAKLLDDLFRKTKSTPCIYWLPLTSEQIAVKKEMRRQHMAEHARRLEEMRRVERNRDRDRRRRSPRK